MFGKKPKQEVKPEAAQQPVPQPQPIQPQYAPLEAQMPVQPQSIPTSLDRESEGLIVQLRQVCRRLLEIELQISSKSIKERDESNIGGLKSYGTLLNEAEALQLVKGDLIHQLQQKNVPDSDINIYIQGALAGIQGYVPEFQGAK